MLFIVECFVACVIFTVAIVGSTYKDPIKQLYNYLPEIIKRVESLPQYKGKIPKNETKWGVKIAACILFTFLLGLIAYFSGTRTFSKTLVYTYGLWLVVDWYDALVLDIGIFAHVKRFRLDGTQDMEKAYTNPWFYINGSLKGMVIGLIICVISAVGVEIVSGI